MPSLMATSAMSEEYMIVRFRESITAVLLIVPRPSAPQQPRHQAFALLGQLPGPVDDQIGGRDVVKEEGAYGFGKDLYRQVLHDPAGLEVGSGLTVSSGHRDGCCRSSG